MAGLRLPWHKRRLTKAVRGDFRFVHRLLSMNLGRGYYAYSNFKRAPPCQMDASKSKGYTGGGFVSQCGVYDVVKYGSRACRRLIDELESDVVTVLARSLAKLWRNCIVPFFITPLGHAHVASAPAGFWGIPPVRRRVHRHADPAAASPIGSTSRDGAASR